MLQTVTPEQAGISSVQVAKFVRALDRRGLATHSVLLMRADSIFGEFYWKPFHEAYCHRMYSQTKSFVSIALGFLYDEGKVELDAPICSYFEDKLDHALSCNMQKLTVRQMLTMSTCGDESTLWFDSPDPDRTHLYLNENTGLYPSGTNWDYDSSGSQVLASLVERLAGKPLFDFLTERLFSRLDAFHTAQILKTKNDDSWGDSAMICTTRDIASFARFVLNGGVWNGQRLLSREYLDMATARQVDNDHIGFCTVSTCGYGYQIWSLPGDGFAFHGMGTQFTVCIPGKDLILTVTSDNQGLPDAYGPVWDAFNDFIVEEMQDAPLPENPEAVRMCQELAASLELMHLVGPTESSFRSLLEGREYLCQENPTGITKFRFTFPEPSVGELHYTNAQGDKVLRFGLGKNEFGLFPQLGYAQDHGGVVTTDGSRMKCAVSASWREEKKLVIKTQIIDRYFGNMLAIFAFKDDLALVRMEKHAEDFFKEYNGIFLAKRK